MNYIKELRKLGACKDALEWCKSYPTPQAAWDACERGNWMLFLLGRLAGGPRSKSRKKLVLAACKCARLALRFVEQGETRPRRAIVIAERWAKGRATLAEVMEASKAAFAAFAAAEVSAESAFADYAAVESAYAAHAASYAASEASAEFSSFAVSAASEASAESAYAAHASAETARLDTLAKCAAIVRKMYPKAPRLPKERGK